MFYGDVVVSLVWGCLALRCWVYYYLCWVVARFVWVCLLMAVGWLVGKLVLVVLYCCVLRGSSVWLFWVALDLLLVRWCRFVLGLVVW